MKILVVNIFSKIKQLGTEVFDMYCNFQKDTTNQIENLKINLKKNDELLIQERKYILIQLGKMKNSRKKSQISSLRILI